MVKRLVPGSAALVLNPSSLLAGCDHGNPVSLLVPQLLVCEMRRVPVPPFGLCEEHMRF